MTDLERELFTALEAARPFLAYAHTYDRNECTANELSALDRAMRLTNAALKSAQAR